MDWGGLGKFGELVHNHRLMRGLTVEQLAEAVGMAPSAIRAIESNQNMVPPKDKIEALANALQLKGEDRDTFQTAAELNSPLISAITGLFRRDASDATTAQRSNTTPLVASIIAFMIADVRGYTRFTQARGDAAAARLTTHFAEITHGAIERWDGRLLELRGDEALVIFGSVRQALQAALDMQDRFAQARAAQPDQPLEVGIGVDVGEAVPVDEGYRGAALNRAARLCGLAEGGEILVTKGLTYIAPLVDGVAFTERGRIQLKGFDELVDILAVERAQSSGE